MHNGISNINSFQCVIASTTSARFNTNGAGTPGGALPTTISVGVWTHLAFTCTSAKAVKLYKNGVLASSTTMASAPPTVSRNNVWIAKSTFSDGDALYKGAVSEVRYWSVTRSAAQILASYNTEIAPTTTGLVFYLNYSYILAATSSSVRESCQSRSLSLINSPAAAADSALLTVFTPNSSLFPSIQTAISIVPGAITNVAIYG
ncbi:concanavalin A-like lectin/glucanase domain-containing protein [Tribonema minus]|uniref:Concanavalin A-like lectin/glucanase domain-containing protein n=1 Tax=Tribonema minus TaxID=303371 RepID=A0A835YZ69_9STRA|nr:concanavalin A-like lectin/glucanase domain-containing protein [Tribonema minus]